MLGGTGSIVTGGQEEEKKEEREHHINSEGTLTLQVTEDTLTAFFWGYSSREHLVWIYLCAELTACPGSLDFSKRNI